MRNSDQHLRAVRWGLLLAVLAASLAAFAYLRNQPGPSAVVLAIPILVIAWLTGVREGLVFCLVALLLEIGLSYAFGFNTQEIFFLHGEIFFVPAVLLAAGLAGYLGKLTRSYYLGENDASVRFMTQLNRLIRASLEAEDMPGLLKVLTDQVGELFSADECIFSLYEERGHAPGTLVAYSSGGRSCDMPAGPADPRSLTSAVLEADHAVVVDDLVRAAHGKLVNVEGLPEIRSVLGLPLVVGKQKLGALFVGFSRPYHFSAGEIARGELAARQISLAMTKVLLLEEAREQVTELAGLHEISQVFTPHNDEPGVYRQLTDMLAGLMGMEMCFISLIDPASRELRCQTPAYGLRDDLASTFHFPLDMGVRAWGQSVKKVLCANSIDEVPDEFIPLAKTFGLTSVLVAPLAAPGQKCFGAIFAANKPGGFSHDDARLMEAFAGQVAVVIQNTHLLSAERRRTEELSVLQAVAAAATEADNEDELIERVTRLIGEKLYREYFDIFLLDPITRELGLHTSARLDDGQGESSLPLGVGISGGVARTGRPHRVGDVTSSPEYLSFHPHTLSELCVPMKIEDQVLGVLNAESHSLNAFSEQDEELLSILAGQLATAVQRLRTVKAEHHQTEQLGRANALIRALAQLGARASAAVDPDGVMQTLGSELTKLGGMSCLIALSDSDGGQATIRYASLPKRTVTAIERIAGHKFYDSPIPMEQVSPDPGKPQNASLIVDPNLLITHLLPEFSHQAAVKLLRVIGIIATTSICQLPLVIEGKPIGILWMWGEGLHESDLPTMSLFASQVAIALQNARLLAEVQRLAVTDELTGIFNRRHFFDQSEKEFGRSARYKDPLAALIVDIDHFKQFNDRYGHLIGDRVLREVAHLLQESLRESDVLGRYGGEEFSILLPVTDARAAVRAAERLRQHVADMSIQTEAGELHVQLSIGVAEIDAETPTLQALINRADQAMYMAKQAGRNCVVVK
jgi:diguanylate cyclase (GGDEF)-like protein